MFQTMSALNPNATMSRNALLMFYVMTTPTTHRLCIVSDPGLGKTSLWRQVCKALGMDDAHTYRLSIAQCDPSDINGYLMPSGSGAERRVEFEVADRLKRLCDGKPSSVLFDEFSNAPRSVQAATLRTLDEGWFGDHRAPASCKMVLAMNPPESAVDAQEIGDAVWNRLVTVKFEAPSRDEHVAHMLRAGAAQEFTFPEFDRVAWDKSFREVTALYSAWASKSTATILEDVKSEAVRARWPLAYTTPRSMEAALRILATCRMYGDEAAAMVLLSGTIGSAQAIQMLAFFKSADLIDPEVLLADPSKWTPDAKRPDRTQAQLMSVALAACEERAKPGEAMLRWNAAWDVVGRTLDVMKESDHLCLLAGRYLATNKPKGAMNRKHEELIKRLAPMVRLVLEPSPVAS